ncbi:hypothetical protein KL86PLE_40601 [uncultured Pleomorphomonas sp.]|uniref:Uncharacterized protein n=1 Tax=uncultured Pleomorphomonas sp. TaxID=442121 RepID=A0A212LGW1_9HYPH|nr:hypothetical protein KL86PLE_40601 [uncultured Pleomorphomonas sp.]
MPQRAFSIMLIFFEKLAHPTGFEPVTSAFGGQHSIQLSYGCVIVADTRNTVRIAEFAGKAKEKEVHFAPWADSPENTDGATASGQPLI